MRKSTLLTLVIALLLPTVIAGCGQPDVQDVIGSATLSDIRWETFEPVPDMPASAATAGFDRAELLMPTRVAGVDTFVQLDTGSPYTILWRSELDALGIKYSESDETASVGLAGHWGAVDSLTIGDFVRQDVRVLIVDDKGEATERPVSTGVLGCDLLRGNSLYLDLDKGKVAILPGRIRANGDSVPCVLNQYGKPILSFKAGNEEIKALYDTGASLFTLVVSQRRFTRLTGLDWNSPGLYALSGARPDAPWDMRGTVTKLELAADDVKLPCPAIWTTPGRDVSVPEQEVSLVGNQLFRGQRILVNFRSPSLTILGPAR